MVTDTHAKMEVLLKRVFSTWTLQRGYKENNWSKNNSVGMGPPFMEDLSTKREQ
jgi:hypothetical protein